MSDSQKPVDVKKIKTEEKIPLGYAYGIDFATSDGLLFKGEWWENNTDYLNFIYKTPEDAFYIMNEIKKTPIEYEQEVDCVVIVVAYYEKEEESTFRSLHNKDKTEEMDEILDKAFPLD